MVTTLKILKDRYEVEDKIAAGGMGIVYAATDERLNRRVAVKILDERLAEDPSFVERFRREARSVAALAHPNIARVFDYAEDGKRHFIVMELVEGKDLARVIRDEGSLAPERAALITAQICMALDHAHSAGIVHRDMKPANVIVDGDDRVKVTDFGIARAMGESKLTVTGAVMGSAHYISPEQAGGTEIGPASDIYSTGIVLYEMLTGAVPFTGESLMVVASRHITDDVPPPSALNQDVPEVYDSIVARATAKDPRRRFPDVAAMEAALSGASAPESVGTTAATTVPLAAGGSTAVLETSDAAPTVWPIPGDRWDPYRIGRMVLLAFAVLAVIAAALLLARLGDTDAGSARDPGTGQQEQAPDAAPQFRMPEEELLIGANFEQVTGVLDRWGIEYKLEPVDPGDFGLDLAEGEIVATAPAPGEPVAEGDLVTLFVSDGEDDEDGPGKSEDKGNGKDKEKD